VEKVIYALLVFYTTNNMRQTTITTISRVFF